MLNNRNEFPCQGEIWLINFNILNINEVIKIRPALIISNDIQNEFDRQVIVAAITSNKKEFEKDSKEINGIDVDSKILLSRIQTIFKEHKVRSFLLRR